MKLFGGCSCGQVPYEVDGDHPVRVGICHCETCRQESGSAFSFFGIWPKESALLCPVNSAAGEVGLEAAAFAPLADRRCSIGKTAPTRSRSSSERWIVRRALLFPPMNSGPCGANPGSRTKRGAEAAYARPGFCRAVMTPRDYPVTPDGRYFLVGGRLWRATNPAIAEPERDALDWCVDGCAARGQGCKTRQWVILRRPAPP